MKTRKSANYCVYVTEFRLDFTYITTHHYFHSKDNAIRVAKDYARYYGCGEFEDASGTELFWLQATAERAWVGVQEIVTDD